MEKRRQELAKGNPAINAKNCTPKLNAAIAVEGYTQIKHDLLKMTSGVTLAHNAK